MIACLSAANLRHFTSLRPNHHQMAARHVDEEVLSMSNSTWLGTVELRNGSHLLPHFRTPYAGFSSCSSAGIDRSLLPLLGLLPVCCSFWRSAYSPKSQKIWDPSCAWCLRSRETIWAVDVPLCFPLGVPVGVMVDALFSVRDDVQVSVKRSVPYLQQDRLEW